MALQPDNLTARTQVASLVRVREKDDLFAHLRRGYSHAFFLKVREKVATEIGPK